MEKRGKRVWEAIDINKIYFDASVIVPVFNQMESLRTTLQYFSFQQYPSNKYEIIVVDDGSTDGLMESIEEDAWPSLACKIKYIRQEHQGRAVARNTGVAAAKGERLIFCDADRFPDVNFVKYHVERTLGSGSVAIIGCPWEFFGSRKYLSTSNKDTQLIQKYSRQPMYYTRIQKLYDLNGYTNSGIAWASFLIGNSSVRRKDFYKVGGFDKEFKFWGFEHFQFALRLQKCGVTFQNMYDVSNFHLPHRIEAGYQEAMIEAGTQLLKKINPHYNFDSFKNYCFGEISLQEFELRFCGTLSSQLKDLEPVLIKW
ncbi:glycosyltransferase family 2 protein [Pelosinus fermentans]|uniref:Glycosyl transferase family 2 n=1 Tax=Pelosinus fermentans JBW45 TaxID=1192197 RepID=I9DGF9_9FIRM|nr:glycosyltransferase family 2 protein [Pelosinus fermentans]AJQ26617.1 glycosyl transferase family 2 [Pelosinus fermentans JBW45]